jgi:hypothetical protein
MLRDEILSKGYVIIDDFYTIDEINKMRNICIFNMRLKGNMTTFQSKPNFIVDKDYIGLVQVMRLNDINKKMKEIFHDTPYYFCGHNDIGLNRIVNWHKDTLNNEYKKYQKTDIWNKEHEIYKVLIYLQDNTNHNNGLTIVEDSFLEKDIKIIPDKVKTIHNKVGSLIIFDQRLTHRGQLLIDKTSPDRILISLGFGKDNIYTKEFQEGTVLRQNKQNNGIRKSIF